MDNSQIALSGNFKHNNIFALFILAFVHHAHERGIFVSRDVIANNVSATENESLEQNKINI